MNRHTLVRLNTRGIDVKLRELTFNEYKILCKSLMSHNNLAEISELFDNILKNIDVQFTPNFLEKIILLLYIRELTLGKNINLTAKNHNINTTTDFILDKINKNTEQLKFVYDDIEYNIGLPDNFLFGKENIASFIINSILSVKIGEKTIDLKHLPADKKEEIISYLPSIPVIEIYKKIISKYDDFSFKIRIDKSYNVQLFDGTLIHFLKHIFDEHFPNILDLEYDLRKHLRFNTYDLEQTAYPECKIMLDKLHNEIKEQEKQKDS